MEQLTIFDLRDYQPRLSDDYDKLFASLHNVSDFQHDPAELEKVCLDPRSRLYLGFVGTRAAVMGTLVGPNISYGMSAFGIEDLATQVEFSGNGYGNQMLSHLIKTATNLGGSRIVLTSKPERETARKMYIRKGFKEVEDTSLFRLELG